MLRTSLKDVQGALQELSIPQNRIIMLHSSLFKFGLLEGGSKGVYECIRNELGPDVTIVMPAFTFSYGATRVWHAQKTVGEVGALPEYFRSQIATTRSIHPFHSVTAIGPLSQEVTTGLCPSSFGPGSVFQKLRDMDALNLSVGTEFIGGATFLHVCEEELDVPYRYLKAFPGEIKDMDGNVVDMTFQLHCRKLFDTYAYDNKWDGCWDDLNALNLFKVTHLNGAMFTLSDIKKTLTAFKGFLKADPYYCARTVPIDQAF